jgi:hypothetical protein
VLPRAAPVVAREREPQSLRRVPRRLVYGFARMLPPNTQGDDCAQIINGDGRAL